MGGTRLIWALIAVVVIGLGAFAMYRSWTDGKIGELYTEDREIVLRFVSTREPTDSKSPAEAFGGQRGPTSVGRCRVASRVIPLSEVIAEQAKFYVPTRDRRITGVDTLDRSAFWQEIEDGMAADSSMKVVIFVHRYYYGFERVCLRGAGLQQMLDG